MTTKMISEVCREFRSARTPLLNYPIFRPTSLHAFVHATAHSIPNTNRIQLRIRPEVGSEPVSCIRCHLFTWWYLRRGTGIAPDATCDQPCAAALARSVQRSTVSAQRQSHGANGPHAHGDCRYPRTFAGALQFHPCDRGCLLYTSPSPRD